ncbi:MAG: NADH-quinone oxidoreductase subunit NuoE [Syntrophomonadaceae bacterium]|nr:NADH-quinone oxidoreductase subunit NuoE [Syntrophomonadaceae bacterium]
MAKYDAILNLYKEKDGGLIEAYHALQREYNYIPEDAIEEAAVVFNMSPAKAWGVATFYSYFKVGPRGKYIIRMCESAPCHVAGADAVLEALEQELGIKCGETTADGKFTLELTECVGQCQMTPVVTINSKPYGDLTPAKVAELLKSL